MKKRNLTKKTIAIILIAMLATLICFTGCGEGESNDKPLESAETITVTDDAGRDVEIPAELTKIAPSGATATMMLTPIAYDLLVGVSESPSSERAQYLPEELASLPAFGQFYGSKATLNMEALIEAEPQVVFDLGDMKPSVKEDMDGVQHQTGIPTLFYDGSVKHMAETYRTLGKLLNKEEDAEAVAAFIDKTVEMAERNSAKIQDKDKLSVLYGTGATGLAVNADKSTQAQVIDLIGAKNAIVSDEINHKDGGTIVNMESLYQDEPDVIIFAEGGPYAELKNNQWAELKAVKDDRYYEIPCDPYCWMGGPPSINMVLGVWWLGQLVYPDIYNDYDMVEIAQEYYDVFWHYELSEKEAKQMLKNSYFK